MALKDSLGVCIRDEKRPASGVEQYAVSRLWPDAMHCEKIASELRRGSFPQFVKLIFARVPNEARERLQSPGLDARCARRSDNRRQLLGLNPIQRAEIKQIIVS
jgi:hypothetical protein